MHAAAALRAALLCLLIAGPISCSLEPPQPDAFYDWQTADMPQSPGSLLRVETFAGAPEGANAWRVLYRSTALDGEPIAVSGIIVAPEAASETPRDVVAWAHGTTGVASRCAPSLSGKFFKTVPGLKALLDQGYIVAATDYPGLGTSSPHPYLVGISEGRAVLDSVRAAKHLPEIEASNAFAVWGHSQGGHAALFTGKLSAAYAPELKLAGVAAAAPATDLSTLMRDDIATGPGKVLTAYALWSWNRVYGAPLDPLLDSSAQAAVEDIAEDCIEGGLQALLLHEREKRIDKDFIRGDLTAIEPWKTLLARNSADSAGASAPLFIAQGTADQLVRPAVTFSYAQGACRAGAPVRFDWIEGGAHLAAATKGADEALAWIAARLEGQPAPNDCNNLPAPPAGSK